MARSVILSVMCVVMRLGERGGHSPFVARWVIHFPAFTAEYHAHHSPFQSQFSTVPSSASSFNFQYLLVSLLPFSSCLLLLPCLPVPSTFPSIRSFRRQSLHKMQPIQLDFLLFIAPYVGHSFSSSNLCSTSSLLTRSVQLTFSVLLPHLMSKHLRPIIQSCSVYISIYTYS